MVALSPAQGRAMSAQVKRVNEPEGEDALIQLLAEVRQQLVVVQRDLDRVKQDGEGWRQRALNAEAALVNPSERDWITPREYCDLHSISMSMLNRALNGTCGYSLRGLARKRMIEKTVRWQIHVAATIHHTPKSRKRKNEHKE